MTIETEWKTEGETRRQELMKTLMGDVRWLGKCERRWMRSWVSQRWLMT